MHSEHYASPARLDKGSRLHQQLVLDVCWWPSARPCSDRLRPDLVAGLIVASVSSAALVGPGMATDRAIALALELVIDGPVSDPSAARYSSLWIAFRRYCAQVGADAVADLTPALTEAWVRTLTRRGRAPSASTQRLRRTAIRHLFGVLRSVGITELEPTVDLVLPPRATTTARALTPVEVDWVRSASLSTTIETRQPALLALAEAGATTSEIPKVSAAELDLETGRVWLPGHTKTDARWAALSPWGQTQLARRLRRAPPQASLTSAGEGPIESAQASTSSALRTILDRAGVAHLPGVAIKSLRVGYGLAELQRTGRIEDAACALGMRSLDQTAELLGYDWQQQP